MYRLRLLIAISSIIVLTICAVASLNAAPHIAQFDILTNSPTPLGTATTFTVVSPEPGYTYYWDFGDGTPGFTEGTTVIHTFRTPGTFFVGFVPYYGDSEGGLYRVPVTITASKTIYLPIVRR